MRKVILLLACLVALILTACDGVRQGTEPMDDALQNYLQTYVDEGTPDSLLNQLYDQMMTAPMQGAPDSAWWAQHILIVRKIADDWRARHRAEVQDADR
jgi:hypothetical protein